MKIVDVYGFSRGHLATIRVCSSCGLKVEVMGEEDHLAYCPKCGHKFAKRPKIVDSDKVANLLEEHFKAKETQDDTRGNKQGQGRA